MATMMKPRNVRALAAVAACAFMSWPIIPAEAVPDGDFTVTSDNPTAAELNDLVQFIVTTPASDTAKARNVEGGMDSVIIPRTVYTLGLFRAPRGTSAVHDPVTQDGPDKVIAQMDATTRGIPTIHMPVMFIRQGGNWKLAKSTMCEGVKAVGLPLPCRV